MIRSSDFNFWGRLRTKASFSHIQLSVFEGGLARKRRFYTFDFLKEVSHKSFVFTSFEGSLARKKASFSHLQLWVSRRSRTKSSFLHLQLSPYEGCLARKRRKSFVFTCSTFVRKFRFHKLQFNCHKVAAINFCWFFSFLAPFTFRLRFFLKRFKIVLFRLWHALVPRSGFESRFWPGEAFVLPT